MISQHFSMVGTKENHRILHQPLLHQSGQQPADLVIQMGDGGIVPHLQLPDMGGIPGGRLSVAAEAVPIPAGLVVPVPPDRGL